MDDQRTFVAFAARVGGPARCDRAQGAAPPADKLADMHDEERASTAGWSEAYAEIIERLPAAVAHARWTLCGLSVCVDAVVSLHDAQGLVDARAPAPAVELARELRRRVAAGIGGELRAEWPDATAWLDARIPRRLAAGGTALHVAHVLASLGAPALLALHHRSAEQLAVTDPAIFVAQDDGPVPIAHARSAGPDRQRVYIFEYTAGRRVGDVVAPRSSRIIVRFDEIPLEWDPAFERVASRLGAGSAVLAGFSALGADLQPALHRARALVGAWRAAGVGVVHLELAGYERPAYRDAVLAALAGACTSVGMSASEFRALDPACTDVGEGARHLARRLRVDRVCIHADEWALSATRADPIREQEALLTGCLVAASRAAAGSPVRPTALPAGAAFALPPPAAPADADGYAVVRCAAPYVAQPATTLGLGDSFTAGCLLVLGRARTGMVAPSEERGTT